jgi:hypothetical protein
MTEFSHKLMALTLFIIYMMASVAAAEDLSAKKMSFGKFTVLNAYSFLKIDGTNSDGTTGYAASGVSPSLRFVWRPKIPGSFGLNMGYTIQNATFLESDEKTIQSPSMTFSRFFL